MRDQVQAAELKSLQELVRGPLKLENTKITFLIVNKRINQRFFQVDKQTPSALVNPPAGTVVDKRLVHEEDDLNGSYDFFLVSQQAKQGCVVPTHFYCIYDSAELDKVLLEAFTYQLCYCYLNQTGAIKVPAPCQYAHRIAMYAKNIKGCPLRDKNLFFL